MAQVMKEYVAALILTEERAVANMVLVIAGIMSFQMMTTDLVEEETVVMIKREDGEAMREIAAKVMMIAEGETGIGSGLKADSVKGRMRIEGKETENERGKEIVKDEKESE